MSGILRLRSESPPRLLAVSVSGTIRALGPVLGTEPKRREYSVMLQREAWDDDLARVEIYAVAGTPDAPILQEVPRATRALRIAR